MTYDFSTQAFDVGGIDGACMANLSVPPDAAPTIGGQRRSPTLTVRGAYDRFHRPALTSHDVAKSTLQTYKAALKSWDRSTLAGLDVRDIRQHHLLRYRDEVIDSGRSTATFDCHWRMIKAILNTVIAEGLLGSLPKTPRIKRVPSRQHERPTPEEFDRIVAACDAADWPRHFKCRWARMRLEIPPSEIWRSLYRVAYLTALRRADLLLLSKPSVLSDGIKLVPAKTKKYGKTVFCPEVRGALSASLNPMMGWHAERIFPLSLSRGEEIAAAMDRIAAAADVDRRKVAFHAIRRASLDAWCEADERAAGLISGHGLKGLLPEITRQHYLSREAEAARVVAILKDAAERFRLPASLVV